MQRFERSSPWWYYLLQKHCLHMLTWTLQRKQIPIPPAVSISMISTAWRNFHAGLLHNISQLCCCGHWKSKLYARSTHVPICASTFTKISIFITYPKWYCLLLHTVHPFLWKYPQSMIYNGLKSAMLFKTRDAQQYFLLQFITVIWG